jgi:hypothetical protein
MVSLLVLTAAPDEALALPVAPSELVVALRAELPAMAAAAVALLVALVDVVTVPITAFEVCEPLAAPPDVLT